MKLNPEKVMAAIEQHGARKIGIKIIDIAIGRITGGLGSADLPDTSTFANGLDAVEEALNEKDFDGAARIAQETAEEMLADEGFPTDLMESNTKSISKEAKETKRDKKGTKETKEAKNEKKNWSNIISKNRENHR